MTFNDLEPHNGRYIALLYRIRQLRKSLLCQRGWS